MDLTIGQRLALGFGAALLLLGLLGGVSHLLTGRVAQVRERLVAVVEPRQAAAEQLEHAILYAGIAARAHVLLPDSQRLQAYERAIHQVERELEVLAGLPKEPDGLAVFARVPPLLDRFEAAARAMVDGAKGQGDLVALESAMSRAREELLAAVGGYAAIQKQKVDEAHGEIAAAVENMKRAGLMLSGLVLVLLALSAWLTARSVRGPALALVEASRRLAAGDFAPATALASGGEGAAARRDELAELSQSFGRMAVQLQSREARLQASATLSSALAASLDVRRLCEAGLETMLGHLGAEVGALYLVGEGGRLERRHALGLDGSGESVAIGEGLPGRAAQSRRTVTSAEIPADSPFTIRLGVDKLPPRTVAAVPMVLQDEKVMGVVVVGSLRPLPPDAIGFLEQAATQLAVSVQNALGHARIQKLAAELQEKNETLQVQNEEIRAQQEELQAQHEELQSQNEELQAQGEELRSQGQELQETVERLTASEERYHGLFTHLSEGFALHEMIFDEAGQAVDYRFLAANAAFERATGLQCEQVLGRTLREVIPGIERSWIDRYAEVVKSGGQARFDEFSAALGRHYQVIAFALGSRQFATLFMDITDQKRAEEALREADRNKNEFIAVLSHELRNPLAPIKNSLFVLRRAPPGSEQAERAQVVIERQVKHLARLVEDLLDVTRISRGKVQLQRSPVDLGRLVRQAAEDNAAEFSDRGIELTVDAAAAGVVEGDPARLSQVVGNLLQNAAKFTPRGGKVLLSFEVAGDRARVRVRDSGAGMDRETLDRLFQPFMQADLTLARTNGGLGLGLALVKGLVEMHGGTVRAVSEGRGKGAEFIVELPLGKGLADCVPASTEERGVGRRVLVVEDNVDAAQSLREALELGGHQVEVAYRGGEGIAKAREWRPDVVLCDIGLPDIDGHGVARAFRSDPELRSIYLIALTGYALPEDQKRAAESGFDEHLAKPPSIDHLEKLLKRLAG